VKPSVLATQTYLTAVLMLTVSDRLFDVEMTWTNNGSINFSPFYWQLKNLLEFSNWQKQILHVFNYKVNPMFVTYFLSVSLEPLDDGRRVAVHVAVQGDLSAALGLHTLWSVLEARAV